MTKGLSMLNIIYHTSLLDCLIEAEICLIDRTDRSTIPYIATGLVYVCLKVGRVCCVFSFFRQLLYVCK